MSTRAAVERLTAGAGTVLRGRLHGAGMRTSSIVATAAGEAISRLGLALEDVDLVVLAVPAGQTAELTDRLAEVLELRRV
jgi:3-oxoacyl-[acyl-carrier-protein] synthase III